MHSIEIPVTRGDVAVIVPVYQAVPDKQELMDYVNNRKILKDYPWIIVAPDKLDTAVYQQTPGCIVEYFSQYYFRSITGYNELMLSAEFYERFSKYEYILICQLDAFIFFDGLKEWLGKGYDYVGAPWFRRPLFIFKYILVKTGLKNALSVALHQNIYSCVGNGGLSLRKVSTFLRVAKDDKPVSYWKANEDFYWSFFAKKNDNHLNKPDANDAARFSIELDAKRLMRRQGNFLPMGIHAYDRYEPSFWKKYLPKES